MALPDLDEEQANRVAYSRLAMPQEATTKTATISQRYSTRAEGAQLVHMTGHADRHASDSTQEEGAVARLE